MAVLRELVTVRLARAAAERFAETRSGRLRVEPVDPAHDRELEARLDLGEGQLSRWRVTRSKSEMWQIDGVALTQYMKLFAPDFSLLFPFRAPDADHAAHLVARACATGMLEEVETLLVDREVVDALRAAGARDKEHMFEMGGPL